MKSLGRRVSLLEGAGETVCHEDCLAALMDEDPSAAFDALNSRRSPPERERVAAALSELR